MRISSRQGSAWPRAEPEPEPADQAARAAHRSPAHGDPLRPAGRLADRRPGALHRPPGADPSREARVLGRLSRATSKPGRGGTEGPVLFIQGAAGDQSANPPEGKRDPKAYGELLAGHAIELARGSATSTPKSPTVAAATDVPFLITGQFQERDHVHALRPVVLPRADPEFLPGVRQRHETRDDHGRAQRRAGDRRLARRAVRPARLAAPPTRICPACSSSATATTTCSISRRSRPPPREAMVPTRRSLRSRSAPARP